MDRQVLVLCIFLISSALTIIFILKKPLIKKVVRNKEIKIETFFFGALIGLALVLIFGLLNSSQILTGLIGKDGFSPLGVLILFFSMVFISIYLDTTGFFEYCARLAVQFSGKSGKRLFFSMYAMVSILTIFTSNDIVILTFTPFIYYFTKSMQLDPKPYLISEFFAANTWSMTLYIGNPTNILLASAFGIKFDEYLRWMFFPTLAAGIISILLLYYFFKKQINVEIVINDKVEPKNALSDKVGAILGIIILGNCIIAIALAPYFGIEMWIPAVLFALFLFLCILFRDFVRDRTNDEFIYSINKTLKRLPWGIIPFVLSLFILVEALNQYKITIIIGIFFSELIGTSSSIAIFIFGFTSALSANILNNIPMSVAFVPIIQGVNQEVINASMYATIIGSNLGANITLIGALAGIMWINILREKDYDLTFWDFMKYGLLITPLTLLSSLCVLSLEFLFF